MGPEVSRVKKGTRSSNTTALDALMSVTEVATLLKVPVTTIYQWRHRGEGPRPIRVGRYLRFDPSDVARWIEARKTAS
jgi:excisionase family DNA binding protein